MRPHLPITAAARVTAQQVNGNCLRTLELALQLTTLLGPTSRSPAQEGGPGPALGPASLSPTQEGGPGLTRP